MNDLQGCEVTFFTSFFFFLPLPIAKVSTEAPFGALRSAGCAGAVRAPGTNPLNPKSACPKPKGAHPNPGSSPPSGSSPCFLEASGVLTLWIAALRLRSQALG